MSLFWRNTKGFAKGEPFAGGSKGAESPLLSPRKRLGRSNEHRSFFKLCGELFKRAEEDAIHP